MFKPFICHPVFPSFSHQHIINSFHCVSGSVNGQMESLELRECFFLGGGGCLMGFQLISMIYFIHLFSWSWATADLINQSLTIWQIN